MQQFYMKFKNFTPNYKTLGKKEAFLLSSLLSKNVKIFSVKEASRLASMEKTKVYPLIFSLKKKGWIKEIEKEEKKN